MQVLAPDSTGQADEAPQVIGEVTSGTFSPTRKVGVALALLDPGVSDGDEVLVDVRGRHEAFLVTKPPFVTPST
jgi:aminomethyltransferase